MVWTGGRKRGSLNRNFVEFFWARVGPSDMNGCRNWRGRKNQDGYGKLSRGGKTVSAHRVAWELTHGAIPEGMAVCHTCDNRPCCEVEHLFLGTWADNNADRAAKGRNRIPPRGEESPTAKLTEEQVREIRRRYTPGSGPALAKEFGVYNTTICMIVRRQTWKHVRG